MRQSGFDYRKTEDVRNDIKAFVEVHIEQGKVLESENKTIGVVNGIVGQKRYTINLKGEANHAGTTPMSLRRDTVVAYSEIVTDLTKRARNWRTTCVNVRSCRTCTKHSKCGSWRNYFFNRLSSY